MIFLDYQLTKPQNPSGLARAMNCLKLIDPPKCSFVSLPNTENLTQLWQDELKITVPKINFCQSNEYTRIQIHPPFHTIHFRNKISKKMGMKMRKHDMPKHLALGDNT